ncbi:hypothetical protein JJV70_15660 [Streptomyces sp. JJ66]|uniref:hypothetical protein n=1 Tax=Streptomyces sp. JJ66 TaxID=2803843 RepID=UPI001C568B90|nr:hypothetical protein [Streptomyces sp. JJ66]MBW1603514.1 hypothetical protein [Streptomyces sp. JJ66]
MASAHDIMQRMREVQAAREEAFKPLAEILGQRKELQRQLAETDTPYGEAFAAAEAAGWTAEELKAIGAEEPARRPKARTRARRAPKKETGSGASGPSVPEPSAAPPAVVIPGQEGAAESAATTAGSTSD